MMKKNKTSYDTLKLSEQQWYQKSTHSMNMVMNVTTNHGTIGTNYNNNNIRHNTTTTNNVPNSKSKLSHIVGSISSTTPMITTVVTVPELLVLELHRDSTNAIYRHYTIRGLYRYVLDAIADRTGAVQAGGDIIYQHWSKKSVQLHPNETIQQQQNQGRPTISTILDDSSTQLYINPTYQLNHQNDIVEIDDMTTATTITTTASTTIPTPSTIPVGVIPPASDIVQSPNTGTGNHHHHHHQTTDNLNNNNNHNITYRERLGGYLHPRDMRRLVTPFSTSNEPEIIVRRHVLLLNYDPLRAIVLRDRLLVLVPDGADSLLSRLQQRVRGGNQDVENSIFGTSTVTNNNNTNIQYNGTSRNDDNPIVPPQNDKDTNRQQELNGSNNDDTTDEWNEMASQEWANIPFELQCADAVLHVVATELQEETNEVLTATQVYIERIVHGGHGLHDDPLTIIRAVKDAVQLMSNRVKSFAQSLHRVLDDDEDMALMNVSRLLTHPERFVQPVPQRILNEESDEPELIIESNLQIALTLTNYLDVVQGQINTAKELIDQRLDATRNKLLFANMLISVFTFCVTLGTLVGAFFGMNLKFPGTLHENDFAFNQVIWYTCLGCIIICILIMLVLISTDTIPSRLCHNFNPIRMNRN
jgi:hypothetical protein